MSFTTRTSQIGTHTQPMKCQCQGRREGGGGQGGHVPPPEIPMMKFFKVFLVTRMYGRIGG